MLDDIFGDSTKEFYTIRTANNNTFYMVIDKSSNTENVYMLSMIDENDLNEFLEENTETEAPVVTVLPEETEPATEMVQQEEDPNTDAGTTAGSLVLVGLVAAVGIGAYYFLKIRSKKEDEGTESENLEMDDGLEMINEDEE